VDRTLELSLIDRCIEQQAAGTTTSGPRGSLEANRYLCPDRFKLEMRAVFARLPFPVVHTSTVRESNAFSVVETHLGALLVTRDENGRSHLFFNSCRHRGSVLVTENQGNTRRLSCPYHAWSYATDGRLVNVPDEATCFPGLDKSELGLVAIPSVERFGFVWACPGTDDPDEALEQHLGEMAATLDWLQLGTLHPFGHTRRNWRANWKIVAEGGLETYHFVFAHRDTIGPYFQRNQAVTDRLGPHFRVVMPTKKMEETARLPRGQRNLRDFTHTLLNLMPGDSLLVQKAHVDWIKFRPLAPGETEITITSLVPDDPLALSADRGNHWQRNLDITDRVLTEDFVLGEGIQRSLADGGITEVNYGCNEWALRAFNEAVDSYCEESSR
jgi:phenylpropionate dioxygenase-like ring-hydroxylating dioxygenase large terminal subunit